MDYDEEFHAIVNPIRDSKDAFTSGASEFLELNVDFDTLTPHIQRHWLDVFAYYTSSTDHFYHVGKHRKSDH